MATRMVTDALILLLALDPLNPSLNLKLTPTSSITPISAHDDGRWMSNVCRKKSGAWPWSSHHHHLVSLQSYPKFSLFLESWRDSPIEFNWKGGTKSGAMILYSCLGLESTDYLGCSFPVLGIKQQGNALSGSFPCMIIKAICIASRLARFWSCWVCRLTYCDSLWITWSTTANTYHTSWITLDKSSLAWVGSTDLSCI